MSRGCQHVPDEALSATASWGELRPWVGRLLRDGSPICKDSRMTTLVSWIAYDQRGPSAAYIATDSRISWGVSDVWDGARKCFASREYRDLFGYVGDVLLPSLVLGQFVDSRQPPSSTPSTRRWMAPRTCTCTVGAASAGPAPWSAAGSCATAWRETRRWLSLRVLAAGSIGLAAPGGPVPHEGGCKR